MTKSVPCGTIASMSFRVACLFLMFFASCAIGARAADPMHTIDAALNAMGGAARLEAIHAIDYTADGVRQVTEQSVRPTTPYFIEHFRLHETRDLQTHRTRRENTHETWWLGSYKRTTIINGSTSAMLRKSEWVPGDGERNQEDEEQYA